MRVIICGSRYLTEKDYPALRQAIAESGFDITEVVSGCARGADQLGEIWAKRNNIPVLHFPAEWEEYGKRAGYIRNQATVETADACIAFPKGESRGTRNCISLALEKMGEENVYVVEM